MPSIYNQLIDIHKGDSFVVQTNIEDVVSLEGYSASWIMAVEKDSPTALITKTSASAEQIYFIANAVFVIINKEDTDMLSGIEPDLYYHELRLTDPDGDSNISMCGPFNLRKPQQEI